MLKITGRRDDDLRPVIFFVERWAEIWWVRVLVVYLRYGLMGEVGEN